MTNKQRRRPPRPPERAVAIVGAACRLPGAPDLDAWWRLLAEGRDAVTTLPAGPDLAAALGHPRAAPDATTRKVRA